MVGADGIELGTADVGRGPDIEPCRERGQRVKRLLLAQVKFKRARGGKPIMWSIINKISKEPVCLAFAHIGANDRFKRKHFPNIPPTLDVGGR